MKKLAIDSLGLLKIPLITWALLTAWQSFTGGGTAVESASCAVVEVATNDVGETIIRAEFIIAGTE